MHNARRVLSGLVAAGLPFLLVPSAALAQCFPVTLFAPDGAEGDSFGAAIALSGDTLIVGASLDDGPAGADQGSAHIFRWSGSSWVHEAMLTTSNAAAGDQFGISVAVSGDTAIVGANQSEGPGGADQGSAYVFTRSGTTWTQQAKLTTSDAAAEDVFGISVALSGDAAIVGAYGDDGPAGADQGSAYVFTRSGMTWSQQAKLTASDAAQDDFFGFSVGLSGDTAVVAAVGDDGPAGADQGSAYVFTRSGTTWTQQAKITASDAETGDAFGNSISLSGNTAIVGAFFDDGPGGFVQGSAYVFTRSGMIWTQQAKLTASDAGFGDLFGASVAVSRDTAIVGARFDTGPAGATQGSAYVFTRSGATWTQQATLTAPDAAKGDQLGASVALSGDTAVVAAVGDDGAAGLDQGSAHVFTRLGAEWIGNDQRMIASGGGDGDRFGNAVAISGDTAIVGAYLNDGPPFVSDQGSVYVFTRAGTGWTQQARLAASNADLQDLFGYSVAISGDTVIVGAYATNGGPGSAYVFTRSGTTWTQQAQLTASDGASLDHFGASVALSGNTAIVGADSDDGPAGANQGSAYVFTRSGSTWTEQAKLTAPDAVGFAAFGISVALSGDTAIVGAPLDDGPAGNPQGSSYVFMRSGTTWTQQAQLTAADAGDFDLFGFSVAISGDTAIVGADLHDGPVSANQGSAYVFTRSGTTWTQQAKLTASDAAQDDFFGFSVGLSGDTVIVGAWEDDGPTGAEQGSAYVFTRSGATWTQQAKLTASDAAAEDKFGVAVALSGDTAIVGAYLDDGPSGDDQGSAWLFTVADECLPALVRNVNTESLYPSLQGAIQGAASGDTLEASPPAFWSAAPTDYLGRLLSITSTHAVHQPYVNSVTLADGASLSAAAGKSMRLFGRTTLPPGALGSLRAEEFLLGSGGALNLAPNAYLDLDSAAATLSGATTLFSDSTLNSAGAVSADGEVVMLDGSLSASGFEVSYGGRFIGSGNIYADLTNNSRIYFTGDTLIVGALLNNAAAVITVQIGVTTLIGPLTNNGTIVGVIQNPAFRGGPSTQPGDGFFFQGDLEADAGATLSFPDPVWRLSVAGDFDVAIDSNARFDMSLAELRFTGGSTPQTLDAMSVDTGAQSSGLNPALPGRYPIGTLRIGPGPAAVTVIDAHDNAADGQAMCEAVYCDRLIIEAGATLTNPVCRVYYGEITNNGGTIANPANVIMLPGPCIADLNGDGQVGAADLALLLGAWGPAPGAPADLNHDGVVSAIDLATILGSWGLCP